MFIFVVILLIVLALRESQLFRQNREIKILNRKLNSLLNKRDIAPTEIYSADPIKDLKQRIDLLLTNENISPEDAASPELSYVKIKSLIAEGRKPEAKALAKKELIEPSEFRHVGFR